MGHLPASRERARGLLRNIVLWISFQSVEHLTFMTFSLRLFTSHSNAAHGNYPHLWVIVLGSERIRTCPRSQSQEVKKALGYKQI